MGFASSVGQKNLGPWCGCANVKNIHILYPSKLSNGSSLETKPLTPGPKFGSIYWIQTRADLVLDSQLKMLTNCCFGIDKKMIVIINSQNAVQFSKPTEGENYYINGLSKEASKDLKRWLGNNFLENCWILFLVSKLRSTIISNLRQPDFLVDISIICTLGRN